MDHRSKLAWARKHLDTLDDGIKVFLKTDPYVLTSKYEPKGFTYTAVLREVTDPPDEWRLVVGDIVHALRSSLDTLMYSLAVKNLGRAPTGDEVKQIQFPIVDESKDWPGECGRRLKHVDPAVRTVIEGFQPYHRPDLKIRHALAVLRDLSNVDKHRHILITLASAVSSGIEISGIGLERPAFVKGYVGPIKKGTVVATWRFVGAPVWVHPHMDVQGKLAVDIAFADEWPAWGGSVMGYLAGMHDFIRDTIFPPLESILNSP